jgi:hypothetical protein
VRTLIKAFVAAALGLALGAWLTGRLVADGGPFAVARIGAWNIALSAGAVDADPYTRASLARNGEIPIALGEGLRLVAKTDDAGRKLEPRCVYKIGPRAPAARYWTLELADLDGFPIENPAERYVFRSSEILREGDGTFAIWVSAAAHPGNWLPIGARRRFELVLRLYDSPLSATAGGIEKTAAPSVQQESCL